jgi:hypothetical protein
MVWLVVICMDPLSSIIRMVSLPVRWLSMVAVFVHVSSARSEMSLLRSCRVLL